ncbi:MAG: MarR family transcriptional regulator [Dermatophilaceae bacterium]
MSVWAAVLDDVASRGGTPEQVADRLGLSRPLVQAVLDHAERLGLVAVAGRGCGSGCPSGPEMPTSCAGCPLS